MLTRTAFTLVFLTLALAGAGCGGTAADTSAAIPGPALVMFYTDN